MGVTTAHEFSEDLFAKAYRYQLSVQLLVKECESKDATLSKLMREISELRTCNHSLEEDNFRLKQAILSDQKSESNAEFSEKLLKEFDFILDAIVKSVRPLGLDRKKFLRLISEISRQVPSDGSEASRHALRFDATKKILARGT